MLNRDAYGKNKGQYARELNYEKADNGIWENTFDGKTVTDSELLKNKQLLSLNNKLLSFAGRRCCIPEIEEDYLKIMKYGHFRFGHNAILKKRNGKPMSCKLCRFILSE